MLNGSNLAFEGGGREIPKTGIGISVGIGFHNDTKMGNEGFVIYIYSFVGIYIQSQCIESSKILRCCSRASVLNSRGN